MATLTFVILGGKLTGTAGGHTIAFHCASGGGGGMKLGQSTPEEAAARTDHPLQSFKTNNPFMVYHKAHGVSDRGGPIPPGDYTIQKPAHHAPLGFAARLVPADVHKLHGRAGFFIHGRGKHGSDGCIVPLNPAHYQALMKALTADNGGTLRVLPFFDIDSFFQNPGKGPAGPNHKKP